MKYLLFNYVQNHKRAKTSKNHKFLPVYGLILEKKVLSCTCQIQDVIT